MNHLKQEKLRRLTSIARMYYEKDMTQSEIARVWGSSRPLVSRLLKEAKQYGIVKIEILPFGGDEEGLEEHMRERFGLAGGRLVRERGHDNGTNQDIARVAVSYLRNLNQKNFGIGWGHIIGAVVEELEKGKAIEGMAARVCPLIGNSGVGNRNYHSNELVRVFALQTGALPEYFYAPAFVLSEQEKGLIAELESYQAIYRAWEKLDVALVNIGNYPSVPDFASVARYGDMLNRGKAAGRILNYYLDARGRIFTSQMDHALQIPAELLKKTPEVVGICSANTKPEALAGALNTGLFRHLIAPASVAARALELKEEEAAGADSLSGMSS